MMENRYDKYKDSGVEWIGDIPKHWSKNKIIRLFGIIGSGATPKSSKEDNYNGSINWIQSGDINGGDIEICKNTISYTAFKEYPALKIYQAPFIIVAMYGASVGNISISQIDGCVNQACCVMNETKQNFKYLFYAMNSVKKYLIYRAEGGGQPNISQDKIKNTWLPIPPLSEQQSIADYLDQRCSEIDELITLQEKMITKLQSYKQSVITEAVTKGLDKNAPLKDSGIEWIGKIPEHWSIICLKRLCRISTGNQDTQDSIPDGKYPFFVRSPKVERSNNYTFEGPSILMAGDGVGAGKVFHLADNKFACHQRVYCINQFSVIVNRIYLFYYMSSLFYNIIDSANSKSTVDSVRLPMLAEFPVCIPLKYEQQSIADYLNQRCSEIDELISIKQQKIEKLKEYKKSLIFECVTGKRKVS